MAEPSIRQTRWANFSNERDSDPPGSGNGHPESGRSITARGSNFGLFRDLQGVIDLDAQVSHCTFKFAVAK